MLKQDSTKYLSEPNVLYQQDMHMALYRLHLETQARKTFLEIHNPKYRLRKKVHPKIS